MSKDKEKQIKKAAKEMAQCKELWKELKDWDITLLDGLNNPVKNLSSNFY